MTGTPPPAFIATGPALVGHPPAIVQSSATFRTEIICAPVKPSGTFEKEATAPIIAPALAPEYLLYLRLYQSYLIHSVIPSFCYQTLYDTTLALLLLQIDPVY